MDSEAKKQNMCIVYINIAYRSVTYESDYESGFVASGKNSTLQWPWTGAESCLPPPGLAAGPG